MHLVKATILLKKCDLCDRETVEDIKPFFLACDRFRILHVRQKLSDIISLYLQANSILSSGSEDLANDDNEENIFGTAGLNH